MWPLIALALVLPFGIGAVLGAPYVPILAHDRRKALDLAGLKPGQTIVDLGSGDGRLLRAAAARGLTAIGYEINPFLVLAARVVCWPYRRHVTIHTANIWHTPLPPTDAIYIFILDRYAARLVKKFRTEITQPTLVISYIYELPGCTPVRSTHNTYVYQFGLSTDQA